MSTSGIKHAAAPAERLRVLLDDICAARPMEATRLRSAGHEALAALTNLEARSMLVELPLLARREKRRPCPAAYLTDVLRNDEAFAALAEAAREGIALAGRLTACARCGNAGWR